MAEVLATLSGVAGLLSFTNALLSTIARFLSAISEAPEVILSVKDHIATWQIQLDALSRFSDRHDISPHVKMTLDQGPVMENAKECLARLNQIISDSTPPEGDHTRASEIWYRVAFRRKQSEVEDLLKRMNCTTQHILLALGTNTANAVGELRSDIRDVAMVMVTANEAGVVYTWLRPDFIPPSTDPETIHFEKSDLQEPETCTWLIKSPLWQDWLRGGSTSVDGCRRFMWIHGLPGTGKTILASFLIDTLLDISLGHQSLAGKSALGVSYYYCHQAHNRDETLSFLRWVVRDLCKQLVPPVSTSDMGSLGERASERLNRSIPEQLQRMWQGNQLSIESLMECLQTVVGRFHSQHNKRVYIIIDAVDESVAPRDRLLDVLTQIGTDAQFNNVSLLMTSRRYQDIKEAIDELPSIALATVGLPIPTPATEQQPVTPLIAGSRPSEHTHHFREKGIPPNSPLKPSSPEKTYPPLSAGLLNGEGAKPPTTFGQLSPSKRRCPSDQGGDTSPTRQILQDTLVSPCTSLSMANPHVEKAISVYVETRLMRSKRFKNWPRHAFLVEMRRTLAAKAGGIFRTVACHLDMIDRFQLTDEFRILECIQKMPETIFDTYEQILVTLIPDGGDANREDGEFARAALALMCSDTANIPDAEVLIAASRTTLPQLEARFYTRDKLRKLLGCLVKVTPDPRPRTVFKKRETVLPAAPLFSLAHYTVKEFLYSTKAAGGPASYFAVSAETNQALELRIVFDGLRQFDPRGIRGIPTRYEEYCLEMTDKALDRRPLIVEEDGKLQDAVFACLQYDAPHRTWIAKNANVAKQHFRTWSILSPFERDAAPSHSGTSVLVNLLLLQWPEAAQKYLATLSAAQKKRLWRDSFKLSVQNSRSLPQTNLVHMCVSRRRLDFLKIFTAHGVHFQDPHDDILYRALSEPYDRDSCDGGPTLDLLKELLEHGAESNPVGFRVTPLQVATHYLERSWVQQLLSNHADVQAIGDIAGVDPLPPTNASADPEWYGHEPLKICNETSLDGKLTLGMREGVRKVIRTYLRHEIIVVD